MGRVLRILVLATFLAGCGEKGASPAMRFDAAGFEDQFYLEVRRLAALEPGTGDPRRGLRLAARFCRANGESAARCASRTAGDDATVWTGEVREGKETEVWFDDVQSAPGIPGPLNAARVRLRVEAPAGSPLVVRAEVHLICIR